MDILSGITLLGGLAFFLYGIQVLSSGLERMAGGRLEELLKKMTSSPLKSLLLGAVITAAIQSSSGVTVMLVGLVNSGIMTIGQSIGVIMGSNIGTTMTAWILTLVGIESDNLFVSLLKPENFSLVFAFVGIVMIMASREQKRRDVGTILVGFAVLMYGMKLMSGAVKPLADSPAFASVFTLFRNPILGVLAGLVITAVIQSSSASVGILQALALTGGVSWGAAIPIIMGQNIGTCVTSLLSSIGVSKNARKVAVVHVAFNLIGTAVCLSAYCIVNALFHLPFASRPIDTVGIAAVHSTFNILTTLMLFPFTRQLEQLANRILPDTPQVKTALLDERLLATPSVAISECDHLTDQMSTLALDTLNAAISALDSLDADTVQMILTNENTLDRYEDALGTYLVHLSSRRLSEPDSLKVSKMLHAIGDLERLGDHAVNLLRSAQELQQKKIHFSRQAATELDTLRSAIGDILSLTIRAYQGNDPELAMQVEPLEQTIDKLTDAIRSRHIARLQSGECSIELGFILSDILGDLERVSDHCSNIAVAVIELAHSSFDTHKFLNGIRSDSEQFREALYHFSEKYRLPQ